MHRLCWEYEVGGNWGLRVMFIDDGLHMAEAEVRLSVCANVMWGMRISQ